MNTHRFSAVQQLVVQVERRLVGPLSIRLAARSPAPSLSQHACTLRLTGGSTYQLRLEMEHASIHLVLALLQHPEHLRRIALPMEPVERVRLLELVPALVVPARARRRFGHRERGGVLVGLEENEELRL